MFFLGLILPICYVAGYTGAAIPTQWAVLSIFLAGVFWWTAGRLSWPILGFLCFASVSMLWTLDYGFALWIAFIWALAFWYGTRSESLLELWQGLAVGLSVNSAVAIFQWFGYQPVFTTGGDPGLLFNTTLLGASCSLVAIALICHRQWWYLPGLVPSMWLAHSRGAWLVLGVSLIAKYLHWSIAIGVIVAGGIFYYLALGASDILRVEFWVIAAHHLKWLGNGVGAFNSVYVITGPNTLTHAENVHNDYLQLAFEFGIGAIGVYCVIAAALSRTGARDWPVMVGFATFGLFYFPLWSAIPAFIGCVGAGHILRGYDPVRSVVDRWRRSFQPGAGAEGSISYPMGSDYLPDFARIARTSSITKEASNGRP